MFSRANTKPTTSSASSTAPLPPTADRKPERRSASEVGAERIVPSIISADLTVTGDLVSAGEIQIDGRVEGDIKCASLIIGISGAVTGEVSAQTVRMHGSVSGQVIAKSVFLASTARMIGDVTHESLAIEPGAFMEGHCRRMAEMPDLSLPDRESRSDVGDAGDEAPRLAAVASGGANDAPAGTGTSADEAAPPAAAEAASGSGSSTVKGRKAGS